MAKKEEEQKFTFDISLSVLNHLGRSLYRSFATVLGEAISNSWDADAKNVWIFIDRDKGCFFIKDDGVGMSADDFQNKFLKIGYSKRKSGEQKSSKGRPFIGRKGIGKLALLSCAQKISVISKKKGGEYNRSIYYDLVEFIRKRKRDRQIIVVTHNPNLVVGADAEQVVVANQQGEEGSENKKYKFEYIHQNINRLEAL